MEAAGRFLPPQLLQLTSSALLQPASQIAHTTDVVIVGGGPATLALLCNAAKTNRYSTLI
jgi:NADPH-dependent 2,4-dienoyl-CoA reductase/sulfur reductase-like enzyme